MEKITYQREMPVYAEGEIIVVGGGPAGVAAAVMAARQLRHGHELFQPAEAA